MEWGIQFYSNENPDTQLIYQVIYFLFSRGVVLEANGDLMNMSELYGYDTSIQSLPLDFSQFNAERLCGCLRSDIMTKTKYGKTRSGWITGNMYLKGETNFHFTIYMGRRNDRFYIEIANNNTEVIEEKIFMEFVELYKELFVQFDFLYGGFKSGGVIPFAEEKILEEKPEILNFYSKQLVDKIVREKLLSIPAFRTEELINGGVMLFLPGDKSVNLNHYKQILNNLQENIDILIQSSDPWVWIFSVPGKAETITDVNIELLDMTKKILDFCEGFFIPTTISFNLKTYAQNAPADKRNRELDTVLGRINEVIKSEKGFTYQDILNYFNSIETPKDVVKHIWRINLEGKVKIILRGKDLYIDQNSPNDIYSRSLDPWVSPPWDFANPFEIEIDSFQYRESDPQSLKYSIDFRSYTFIWFYDTEIGKANDNRLKKIFKQLHENFTIESEDSFQS